MKQWWYAATMSNAQEYAYTFRAIVKRKNEHYNTWVRDELVKWAENEGIPLYASNAFDNMTVSVREFADYPGEKLATARALAKRAYEECGVKHSMFFRVYATQLNNRELGTIHGDVICELPDENRHDLTDHMLHEELANRR